MIAAALTAILLAGAAPPCVTPSAGAGAKAKGWYIVGSAVAFEGRVWEKYGLPRVLMPGEVAQIGVYKGAAVYKEASAAEYEVIYVLADLADCSFQPYQVKG